MRIIRNNYYYTTAMNSDASHFLFFSFGDEGAKGEDDLGETEDGDTDDLEDEEDIEDEEDDDPFEMSTTNPWEYDDQDNF